MIRLILVCIFLLIIFVLSLILFPIEWLIGRISPKAKDISSLRFVQFVFKVILFLSGVSTTVIGLENIPKDEPGVFIGNHRGFFDTVVSYSRMPRLTGFIAKKEMIGIPLLNLWMEQMNCLFLDRANIKEGLKTILTGIEKVKGGVSMWIFPEGTRNESKDPADLMEFHEGSLKIAEKSGCPVIPVAITGTDDVFERHTPWIRKSHVIIEYGEPIYLKELPPDKKKFPGAYTRDVISSMLRRQMEEREGK